VGFDLMTGEAALYEADTCRIHVGPGKCSSCVGKNTLDTVYPQMQTTCLHTASAC
jgi:hypothetical protein